MNLWLYVWPFSRRLVIFTDFSPEMNELMSCFLAIPTDFIEERGELIILGYFHEFEANKE